MNHFVSLQRPVPDAPGGSLPVQGSSPEPSVPGSVQGTLLFRQRPRLHTRIRHGKDIFISIKKHRTIIFLVSFDLILPESWQH